MSQGSKSAGHPVNVATGEMFSDYKDISIPGKFPLIWKRHYSTNLIEASPTPLGQGWTCPYFSKLTRVDKNYIFQTPDGGFDTFADPEDVVDRGKVIRNPGTFSEISKQGFYLRITKWNVETGEILRFHFKPGRNGQPWPLQSLEYPNGQGLELAWDENGFLKGVRQKLEKRILVFNYTATGRIATISFQYPDLRQQVLVRYEYDRNNRLATAINALGFADRYEYDEAGRIVREIVKDGGVFSFKYDDKGRCIRTTGLDNYDLKILRYFDATRWTEVINSYGHVTRYQWLVTGQIVLEVRPLGGQFKTEFDENGRIISKVDALGNEYRFEYDEMGDRTKIIDPLGRITLDTYNVNHQPIKQVTPGGNVFRREYDLSGRLVKTIDPMDGQWTMHYDQDGNTIKVEMGTRHVEWFYGPKGNLLATQDPEGNRTNFRMDDFGRLIEKTGPLGDVWIYRYDLIGRKVEESRPDGTRTLNSRDAGGNVNAIADANNSLNRNVYGFCGRLLSITDSQGGTTRMTWGTEPGMLLSIQNPMGEEYLFSYDAEGKTVYTRDFSGIEKRLTYNTLGNVVTCTTGEAEKITYVRDAVSRLIGIELSDGTSISYEFSDSNFLIKASSNDSEIEYKRDKLGRTLREETDGFWIEYGYNSDGKIIQTLTSESLNIHYALDKRDLLKSLSINDELSLSISRNQAGAEVIREFSGAYRLEQTVDSIGRLYQQRVSHNPKNTLTSYSNKPLILRDYTWKGAVITGIRDNTWGTDTFFYDANEHLIQATRTGAATRDFRYDISGNLTALNFNGTTESRTLAAGNILIQKGDSHFQYDAQGRLIRKILAPGFPGGPSPVWEYTWDPLDQLRSVTNPDGEKWEYGYDALGRRIYKRGPDTEIVYRWDQDTPIHEVRKDIEVKSWIFDLHTFKPLGMSHQGLFFPVITDHLGTPREMLDKAGQIIWSAQFGPWGELESENGESLDCPIRFQGQWYDAESGFHYSRWRYYDPAMGRFISSDPLGLLGGLNAYRYCPNPINWIDPMGLDWNYVLVDGQDKPYYTGVSTQDPKQVEDRHAANIGNDRQPRFDPSKGDKLIPITPIDKTSDNHEVARGLEQKAAEDLGTIKGRQGSDKNNENGGTTRGNLQNPVDPKRDVAGPRKDAAEKLLADQDKTVKDLVEEGIKKRKAEDEEKGCDG